MMNVKILVCCHKQNFVPDDEMFLPIHVGKALSGVELPFQGDDTGDNISCKNKEYCELTGLYWAWKNLKDVDIIGFCHYRRYFDFYYKKGYPFNVCQESEITNKKLKVPSRIIRKVYEGKILIPSKKDFNVPIGHFYCKEHMSEDYRALVSVMEKQQENYRKSFRKIMEKGSRISLFNMFIMKWQDFDNYCSWLFDILHQLEQKIDVEGRDAYQRRVYGFLSERLLNVWLHANGKKTMECPVLCFSDQEKHGTNYLIYKIKRYKNVFARFLMKL